MEHRIRSKLGLFLRIDSPAFLGVDSQVCSNLTIPKSQSQPHQFSQYTQFRTFPPYSIPSKSTAPLSVWKLTQVHAILFSIPTGGTGKVDQYFAEVRFSKIFHEISYQYSVSQTSRFGSTVDPSNSASFFSIEPTQLPYSDANESQNFISFQYISLNLSQFQLQ